MHICIIMFLLLCYVLLCSLCLFPVLSLIHFLCICFSLLIVRVIAYHNSLVMTVEDASLLRRHTRSRIVMYLGQLTVIILLLLWLSHSLLLSRSLTFLATCGAIAWLYRTLTTLIHNHTAHVTAQLRTEHERYLRTAADRATGTQLVNLLCRSQHAAMTLPSNEALQRFLPVWQNTECMFARTATLWGSPAWHASLTLGKPTL